MKVKSTLVSGTKEATGLLETLEYNLEVIQSRIKDLMEIVSEYRTDGSNTLMSGGSIGNLPMQSVISQDLKENSVSSGPSAAAGSRR